MIIDWNIVIIMAKWINEGEAQVILLRQETILREQPSSLCRKKWETTAQLQV